jgi:hypothetical protein
MGAAKDAIERKHRKWHGKQVKKGMKRAKAQRRVVKNATNELSKTTKRAIVKTMFSVSSKKNG